LRPGDTLHTPTGSIEITALTIHPRITTTVHELDTNLTDTYSTHTGTHDLLVHNCDLTSADLGELIGTGGNKDVYAYDDDSVVGILHNGKSPTDLAREVELLASLEELGLPVVRAELIRVDGKDAILYDRYALGSKDVVRTVEKRPRIVGDTDLLNQRSIQDLRRIREMLIDQRIKIDDLQFLIGEDGSIVIADPLAVATDRPPSLNNLRTIDRLIDAASR
ncbi:MAG: hypothetical protein AAGE88_21960, partial [Actinomycetota bacterium]